MDITLESLIKKYYEYKQKPDSGYNEQYKWEFLKQHHGVFSDLTNLSEKIRALGSENFFPYFYLQGGFKFLTRNPDITTFFATELNSLFNEAQPLEGRINTFIKNIESKLREDPEWRVKELANPGVETPAFLLFLREPQKYLLFTKLKPFKKFAKKFILSKAELIIA